MQNALLTASFNSADSPHAKNSATPRHEIHETAKLKRDGLQVGINIRVIVFEGRQNQFVGMIVEKFRAFVEECGVVLVALDDEFFPAAEAVTSIVEIRRDAAD